MRSMTLHALLAAATTAWLVCLTAVPVDAQNPSQNDALRVLSSNGMKGAMEELTPQLEKAIGRRLAIQFSSTAALKKRIESGEAFDVAIITTEAIADLITRG